MSQQRGHGRRPAVPAVHVVGLPYAPAVESRGIQPGTLMSRRHRGPTRRSEALADAA
jgi:hypothetical protein